MPRSEALALVGVAALAVIGIIVCAVSHVAIPTVLGDLAFVAIGGGAGASLPSRAGIVSTPVNPPPPTA